MSDESHGSYVDAMYTLAKIYDLGRRFTMRRHDPRYIRAFLEDGSLHCKVHGRLEREEVEDLLARLPFRPGDAVAIEASARASVWGWMHLAYGELVYRFGRPDCKPLRVD